MTARISAWENTSPVELEEPRSSGTAFLLWLACLAGVCGIHRFYLGRPLSGSPSAG
jgi:hypothetical protein